jgi:hypothetical protein
MDDSGRTKYPVLFRVYVAVQFSLTLCAVLIYPLGFLLPHHLGLPWASFHHDLVLGSWAVHLHPCRMNTWRFRRLMCTITQLTHRMDFISLLLGFIIPSTDLWRSEFRGALSRSASRLRVRTRFIPVPIADRGHIITTPALPVHTFARMT